MSGGKLSAFLRQYSVTITMIPTLILVHWGWLKLQNIDELVKEEERGKEFPLLHLFHKLQSAKQLDNNIQTFKHQPD